MGTETLVSSTLISARRFPIKGMLWGGLVAGILDGLDAILYFGITKGATANGIFRYIAGGLIGLECARRGGWDIVVLGIALHFLIATGAAATYCTAGLFLPCLTRRPLVWGPLFRVAVYVFMDFVVLPLSMLPQQGHGGSAAVFVNEILIHMFGVGLPIAVCAARWMRNTR